MFASKSIKLMDGWQFVYNGTVIADNIGDLKEWIRNHCDDEFREYINDNFDEFTLNTLTEDPIEVLEALGTYAYDDEMDYWIDSVVVCDAGELSNLGIDVVEILPPEGREYRIEPVSEPWTVNGTEIMDYYEDAPGMEVGDIYENGAYRVIRTKNRARGFCR